MYVEAPNASESEELVVITMETGRKVVLARKSAPRPGRRDPLLVWLVPDVPDATRPPAPELFRSYLFSAWRFPRLAARLARASAEDEAALRAENEDARAKAPSGVAPPPAESPAGATKPLAAHAAHPAVAPGDVAAAVLAEQVRVMQQRAWSERAVRDVGGLGAAASTALASTVDLRADPTSRRAPAEAGPACKRCERPLSPGEELLSMPGEGPLCSLCIRATFEAAQDAGRCSCGGTLDPQPAVGGTAGPWRCARCGEEWR